MSTTRMARLWLILATTAALLLFAACATGTTAKQTDTAVPTVTAQPQVTPHVTYSGHSDAVEAVAWSPDGTRIASASDDRTVQMWDTRSGHTLLTYRGHSDKIFAVAWSPDGKLLASGSLDKTVQIWQPQD